MSESVRYFLESRVPELEDLFKKGLFSKDEIKEVVAKRTKFEHKIKRRGAILEDFLAYIQYETELEQTRKQRYEMLNIRAKHSVSDHSIVKYILSLYRRAVTKFRGNMVLWDQYINFAKESKSDKAMPKILASALQLHPESVDIWIKAANWEFKHLNNPASARALFLRGIRMNKESKSLWFEYFRMELEVANTLAEKKLELSEKTEEEKSELTVFDGAIAISVFKFALKECILTAEEAYEYYRLSMSYENLSTVTQFIESFVSENMSDKSKFYILKARYEISSIDSETEDTASRLQKCSGLLDQSLECSPLTSEVISSVISVILICLEKSDEHEDIKLTYLNKVKNIIKTGESLELLTPEIYLSLIEISKMNSMNIESQLLEKALSKFPDHHLLINKKVSFNLNSEITDVAMICSTISPMIKSSESCLDALNNLFEKYQECKDADLLKLSLLAANNFVPSVQVIKYILKHSSEAELINSFDILKLQPEFCNVMMQVIIEYRIFSEVVKKFVNKLSVFSSKVFSAQESALSLIQFSIIIGDIELCNRLYSKSVSSLPPVAVERFISSFEELKEKIGMFSF